MVAKIVKKIKMLTTALWGESDSHQALLNLPPEAIVRDIITLDSKTNPGAAIDVPDGDYMAATIVFPDTETLRSVCSLGLKLADELDKEAKEREKEGNDEKAPPEEKV
jgi:hypothetical protein